MDAHVFTWVLLVFTIFLIGAVFALAYSIAGLANSETYRKKVQEIKDAAKKSAPVLIGALALLSPELLFASDAAATAETIAWYRRAFTPTEMMIVLTLDLLLIAMIIYLKINLDKLLSMGRPAEMKISEQSEVAAVTQLLTDVVAIEDEESILFDHEYDGIQELDNNLPPWWKWGFYASIVWGIVYMMHFHVLETGVLQVQAYEIEVAEADAALKAMQAKDVNFVDENTVTLVTDAASLEAGKNLFVNSCATCHAEDGGGLVGPNLTDDAWLYGNSINEIFAIVKHGTKKGMQKWGGIMSATQMQNVSSYVTTLQGTKPMKAKDAEGEEMANKYWNEDGSLKVSDSSEEQSSDSGDSEDNDSSDSTNVSDSGDSSGEPENVDG